MQLRKKLELAYDIVLLKIGCPRPFSAAIDLTDRCNSRCRICKIWEKKDKHELDPRVFRRAMAKSKVLQNIKFFNFGGGEPFLMDNLREFVEAVADYADPIQVRFVTNGFAYRRVERCMSGLLKEFSNPKSPSRKKRKASSICFGIKVSIDGVGLTHDRVRNIPGGYERAIKSVDALIELRKKYPNNLTIGIGFTACSLNYKDLAAVREVCAERNIAFFHKPVLNPEKFSIGNLDESLILDNGEQEHIIRFNEELVNSFNGIPLLERSLYRWFYKVMNQTFQNPGHRHVPCYAASASFYLVPNGDVTPCLMWDEPLGNINCDNFDELWIGERARGIRGKIQTGQCYCLTSCDTFPSIIVDKFPFYLR